MRNTNSLRYETTIQLYRFTITLKTYLQLDTLQLYGTLGPGGGAPPIFRDLLATSRDT